MTFEEIIDRLSLILNELDARETSGNCYIFVKEGTEEDCTWKGLCNKGIEYFKQLRDGVGIRYD